MVRSFWARCASIQLRRALAGDGGAAPPRAAAHHVLGGPGGRRGRGALVKIKTGSCVRRMSCAEDICLRAGAVEDF